MTDREFGFTTRTVHAGSRPDPATGARALPIYQTTSYVFEDTAAAASYFNLQEYGNTYSRIMNPTVAAFEERIANLDDGAGAVAFASGLAAQSAALFTLLQPGDHVIASSALYGGTITQLKHYLGKLSVALDFVDPDDMDAWRAALKDETKLLFAETIGNPGGNVLNIEQVAGIAHEHECPLMIDNTFATPYLCRPLEWGADIVVYSATKFLGGHGTSLGGVVVESGEFNWSNGRFPVVADPSPAYHGLAFHETFGVYGYLMKLRRRNATRPRRGDQSFQCVPPRARSRDAAASHAATCRERTNSGGVPGKLPGHHPRQLSGSAEEPASCTC